MQLSKIFGNHKNCCYFNIRNLWSYHA